MLERILSLSPDIVASPLYAWNRTAVLSLSRRIRETNPRINSLQEGPKPPPMQGRSLRRGNWTSWCEVREKPSFQRSSRF